MKMPKTMDNLILDSLKGKYFQHIKNPEQLIEKVNSVGPPKEEALGATFLAYSPTLEKQVLISMYDLSQYEEISSEKFKKAAQTYKNNKANLSAEEINYLSNLKENIAPGQASPL